MQKKNVVSYRVNECNLGFGFLAESRLTVGLADARSREANGADFIYCRVNFRRNRYGKKLLVARNAHLCCEVIALNLMNLVVELRV